MQLRGALVLFATLSTACALKCYSCSVSESKPCTKIESCSVLFNHCYSLKVFGVGLVSKGCQNSVACVKPFSCCEGDLCNNALATGPSIVLLLLSSALITLFV
ncbi:prostate stem cell antigen-like [Aulostomus maculatus]